MYELIILSLLMRWPLHGYHIAKITNDVIGPWAKVSSGTLYTMLAKLEREGLIAVAPDRGDGPRGERPARTFAITEEGRKRFRQVMMDTTSNLGDYQKLFRYKCGYLDLLRPEERLLLLNHYANYCQAVILHVQTEMDGLVYELAEHPDPAYLEQVLTGMRHIVAQWQAELDWVRGMRDRELAAQASQSTVQPPGDRFGDRAVTAHATEGEVGGQARRKRSSASGVRRPPPPGGRNHGGRRLPADAGGDVDQDERSERDEEAE
jgi:DNA-binding PadR family transcriptional regulator